MLLDYVAAERDPARGGRRARRGRRRGLPRGGRRARRRRDGRAARHLRATASSTSPAPASASSTRDELVDGSTVEAGDAVIGFAVGRRARERLHARPPRARGRGLRRRRPARPDAALPRRRRARSRGRAKAFAHVTGGGILGNLERVLPDGPRARDRLGRVGAPARLRTGSRATSRRRSCGASSTSASAGARSSREPASRRDA